jgi:chaperone modulatory protein CbpM
MNGNEMVSIREFCTHYNIEDRFLQRLQEHGLVSVIHVEEDDFIPLEDLQALEKLIRLHYEMDINLEGIEAILNLLDRVESMNREIILLRNRLSFYESGSDL